MMCDQLEIAATDPRSPDALELVRALSVELAERYDFVNDGSGAFKPEDVLVPRAAFVVGRLAGRAVACGALRPLESDIAEIKRMFVVADCRGRGFSKVILRELERQARAMGYRAIHLETGTRQPEAIHLYENTGFHRIPSFGIYLNCENSLCFGKFLNES